MLKSQNEKLRRQLDELNDKFKTISTDLENLQEDYQTLMQVNQEFGRENDELSAKVYRYQSQSQESLRRLSAGEETSSTIKRQRKKKSPKGSKKKAKRPKYRSTPDESSDESSWYESDAHTQIDEKKARVCIFFVRFDGLYRYLPDYIFFCE
jgi:chromosome segregation ATPase